MAKNIKLMSFGILFLAGCASNGGGYVVGNSAIPPNTAQKIAKTESCGCAHHKGKDHKNCKESGCAACGEKGKSESCSAEGH